MDASEYDHVAVEAAVRRLWEEHDIYRFDPAPGTGVAPGDRDASGPVFSVDTPPPYVSASHLHVGHAMSYSQPDFIVRYRRMRGERIFYPMGFDDNGLPTERYVEKAHAVKAADLPRARFVELCLEETSRTAARYEQLWRRLGLSVDWSLRYSTIDDRCRRTAQASFIKLYEQGHITRAEDPILWCAECRTALAQADVEDLERTGKLYEIRFAAPDGGEGRDGVPLTIATTRPELLPAAVALYHHPDDPRYSSLSGATARVPLSGREIPIRSDGDVDPSFGTGLMMVCTFGDSEDVVRWRRDLLDLRLVVTEDGRLGELGGAYAGLPLAQARTRIVADLAAAGHLGQTTSLRQSVGVHERCLTPVEFAVRPQWFVGVRAQRDVLLRRAEELEWVPSFMRRRLEDWINGLKWDWNISRQRHYGVPMPVWFCGDCGRPVLAELTALPVDPLADAPPVPACPDCAATAFTPDPDVMDTWMTSSLTPQVNDGWALRDFASDAALAPMSLRVQAFEIIRTWLYYTMVQTQLHFDRLPWHTVMISGWGLNEQGKKIAKRDLDQSTTDDGFNRYIPDQVIDRYGADALRLWATKARIGNDLRYHEKDVRAGRKFTIKLWNVARFVQRNLDQDKLDQDNLDQDDPRPAAVPMAERTAVDRWLLAHLAETVTEVTAAMDAYDFMGAHLAASKFFWSIYCDRYLEMVKDRFLRTEEHTDAERDSARATLWESLRTVIALFAPFTPFVTEHLYQNLYQRYEDAASLHLTSWPAVDDSWRADRAEIDAMAKVLDAVRAARSQLNLGSATRIATLVLDPRTAPAKDLAGVIAEPLRTAARANEVVVGSATTESGVADLYVGVLA